MIDIGNKAPYMIAAYNYHINHMDINIPSKLV